MDNFAICILMLPVLSLTELGKTCEDHGLIWLLDAAECKNAIEKLGFSYEGPQVQETHPRGCYVSVVNGNIKKGYLNNHKTGSGHQKAKAICQGNKQSSTFNNDSYNYADTCTSYFIVLYLFNF